MDLPKGSVDILITCGKLAAVTQFNEQTNIEQVHSFIQQQFPCRSNLLNSYRIVYYDSTTCSFVDLEDRLRNGINPFQLNSTMGVEDVENPLENIRLYVVNRSPINFNSHSSIEAQDDQIVFDSSDNDSETQPESNLYMHINATNDEALQDHAAYSTDTNEGFSSQTIPSPNIASKRLCFSLDVKPKQRSIYRSDQFNIRKQKSNGRIARVQGIKKENQKMSQVLPKLQIPSIYIGSNATLLVAVVLERIEKGMRIWYKHPDKGFLPKIYTEDSEMINPIAYNLNECELSTDGDLPLSLQMITKWDKTHQDLVEFHRLDERKTLELHSASNVEYSPRLICVIQQNGVIDWNTICLSDFIRSTKQPKRRSSSVNTERTCSPQRKRAKANN